MPHYRTAFRPIPPKTALLRVTTAPSGLDLLEGLDAQASDPVAWLMHAWQAEEVQTAIAVASPALTAQIDGILTAGHPDPDRVRRVVRAVASYLLRWQGRATPFGLFAGVGVAHVGGPARGRLGTHRAIGRANAAWLASILTRLHDCPELMKRVPVVASNAGIIRGGRLVLPGHPSDSTASEMAPVEVSVRWTPPVRVALGAAREPVPLGKLARQLRADFQAVMPARVDDLLAGLLAQGALVSGLRAPMTCPDALGHLCRQLRKARAEDIPAVSGLVTELAAIHQVIAKAADGPALLAVASRMTAISQAAEFPLAIDTTVDCDVCVPEQVAREACDAALVLHRVSPYPSGLPAWAEYHQQFLDRYGPGTLVPVLELVADSGLGLPAGYLSSPLSRPGHVVTQRDTMLLALVQKATVGGGSEIVLSDKLIEDLAGRTPARLRLPPRAEIAIEIRAASAGDLDRGRFTLVVTGTPRPGNSMIGRHTHLLDAQDGDDLARSFAVTAPGAVAAQLSFAPRGRHDDNVARTARMLPTVISIGEHWADAEGVVPLADLVVAADADEFFLIRASTGQLIEPRGTSALEAVVHMPPLARFFSEVTTSRCAAYTAFDFGAASRLPWLPRVRYRRTILSPARWLLPAGDLPGPAMPMSEWETALQSWRQRWRVPDHVAITEADRRLPVDLDRPSHRELLRDRLRRAAQVELRESAAPEELGWIGRAHHLVLPLALDEAATRRAATVAWPSRGGAGRTGERAVRLKVLKVLVFGHPERFTEILTGHVPGLVTTLGEGVTWWFRQQTARDPHLAIRLALASPHDFGPATRESLAWADRLRGERLASRCMLGIDDAHAGLPDAEAVHCVLAADSIAAIAQITLCDLARTSPPPVTAASMTDLAAELAPSLAEGMRWLLDMLPREAGPVDRTLREQALALTDRAIGRECLAALPGGRAVAVAWEHRAAALGEYKCQAGDRVSAMFRFLVEEHQARVTGTGDARIARHLARASAMRCLAALDRRSA